MQKNSILITGGGTGGHLFPAIAMANRFRLEGWYVELVGSKIGLESKILKNYDFKYHLLGVSGFVGKSVVKKIKAIVMLIFAIIRSIKILKDLRPKLLLSTGGFVSLPISIAAKIIGIPVFAMEQNSFPGLASRIIGKFAEHVFLNFSTAARFFKETKFSVVGNPIRTDIKKAQKGIKHKNFPITVVILGGSRGAETINNAAIEMSKFIKTDNSLNLIIQTGTNLFKQVSAAYRNIDNAKVIQFIDDMGDIYNAADLAVSRAGATTISELSYLLIPAIFVPYPFAANNHQKINADEIVRTGGATIIENGKLSGELLYRTIKEISVRLQEMSDSLKKIGRPDADIVILRKIKDMLHDFKHDL
ncbi:MAG: undecaprenyldiphospho-muramoylpentapeptide beta-N-acetylglucosaminyltransferase [Epsilonproteobacteria bacterium]|nr:undecaprenyldiphospho-muramoylpentapeptide beta-N-acetylglucosaminyltransferase [Campylobacterota bacterium]